LALLSPASAQTPSGRRTRDPALREPAACAGCIPGMRRLAVVIALLMTLAVAPAAHAKELQAVKACGTDRCVSSKDRSVLAALRDGGPPSVPPGSRARSILLRVSVGDGSGKEMGVWMVAWVPKFHMLVSEDGAWMAPPARSVRVFERLTRGLKTFPPSELHRLGQAEIDLPTAAPPPPIRPAPAGAPAKADADASLDWLLIVPAAAAIALVGVALARRRRPGGGTAPRAA
jgi:hypothetical protein